MWTKIPQTPTNRTTMNRNLRHEPKMNRVQANHPVIDSNIESQGAEKIQEIENFQLHIGHLGIGVIVLYCVHIVWNVQFEEVSLRQVFFSH